MNVTIHGTFELDYGSVTIVVEDIDAQTAANYYNTAKAAVLKEEK